jgi:hypothetical protein
MKGMIPPTGATNPSTTVPHGSGSHNLVKTSKGEITAASAQANPALAAGLIKLKNGNYAYPIVSAADRASGIAAVIPDLKLGG